MPYIGSSNVATMVPLCGTRDFEILRISLDERENSIIEIS